MNKEDRQKIPRGKGISLEISFESSEDIPIVYAGNVFVRHMEDMFIITFAQAHGPYIVNPTVEQLKQIGKIPAKVVARIAVPPSQMKEILDVLNGNYDQFLKGQKGKA